MTNVKDFRPETRFEAPYPIDHIIQDIGARATSAAVLPETARDNETSNWIRGQEVRDAKGPYGEFIENGLQPHEIEIRRAFEQFNLPILTVERLRTMPAGERSRLALHFVSFISFAERHGRVFATEGGPDPSLTMSREHGFESPEQAVDYGYKLIRFAQAVKSQTPFRYLEDHTQPHKTPSQLSEMSKRARNDIKKHGGMPTVFVDTKTDKLKLWYE